MKLTAQAGPLRVWIEDAGRKRRVSESYVAVGIPGPRGFRDVVIRPESLLPLPWKQEIEIGDKSFDSMFFIQGPARLVFALLDAEARRLLARASTMSLLKLSSGALQAEMRDKEVPHILPLLLDIGQRCHQSLAVDTPRRLAEIADEDPEAGVRLQNLLLLIRELPGDPATIEALRTACSDASPEIRLQAAAALGAEGRGV